MASVEKKIFKCDSFSSTFIAGLDSLRKSNHLTDIVLNVQGREFSCHKLVLAANSKYFFTTFTEGFNERNLKEIRMPPEIASDAMETILDYFYSGELALSQSNIESVFEATDYMRLESLLAICIEYMQETLNLSNSVKSFLLAEKIKYSSSRMEDLKKASSVLIVSDVEEISGNEDFLNLSEKLITKILNYNNEPTMAESLYWVILKWVSHDEETRQQFLYDMLRTLPIEGISDSFLTSKMRNEDLLRRDSKSIMWVMEHATSRLTTISLTQSQESLFLLAERRLSTQKCFFVKKAVNPTSHPIQDRPRISLFSAVSYKKRIYLLCGDRTEKSYRLNDPYESWVDCHLNFKFGRRSAGCVVLGDDLFVVGGCDWKNNLTLNSCMKFNFCSGRKQDLPAMREAREVPGVAVYANSLYVSCGFGLSSSIDRFDPREGQWCTTGQYTTKFGVCCSTTVDDYLYCCNLPSGNVERFDFRVNQSQQICSLPSECESKKLCWISSVENELLGARGEKIWIYDAVNDKWSDFCCATDVCDPIIVPWV